MKKTSKTLAIILCCIGAINIVGILFCVGVILKLKFDPTVYNWQLAQDKSQITHLYVVDAKFPSDYEIIKEISLDKKDEFVDDIISIEYKKYGWNPHTTNGLCFVIKYQNQDYDIISSYEPERVYYNDDTKKFSSTFSWLECDDEVFQDLIAKYME